MQEVFPDPAILLHPQIPKPLHLLNPRTILGRVWWDEQRKIAYAKHNYCCHACGTHKLLAIYRQWLEGHEIYNIDYATGKVEFIRLVALCPACHNFIHSGRMQMLVAEGKMSEKDYKAIIDRGKSLLRAAGIKDTRERELTVDEWKPVGYDDVRVNDYWTEWNIDEKKLYTFRCINHWVEEKVETECAWEDWHLVLYGNNYGQRFHSFSEWQNYFQKQRKSGRHL